MVVVSGRACTTPALLTEGGQEKDIGSALDPGEVIKLHRAGIGQCYKKSKWHNENISIK